MFINVARLLMFIYQLITNGNQGLQAAVVMCCRIASLLSQLSVFCFRVKAIVLEDTVCGQSLTGSLLH
jgi:hypothetical protein